MNKPVALLNRTREIFSQPPSEQHEAETSFTRRAENVTIVVITCLTALFLLPITQTPLLGDDSQNSYFIGYMGYNHLNAWQWFVEYNRLVIAGGRFFPGMTVVQIIKFALTQSALTLKIANIVAVCVNIATFFFVMRLLAGARFALLSAIFVVTTFQIRAFYESLAEITIENQFVLETILVTTILAIVYARKPRPSTLFWFAFSYAVSCATYEISFLFIFLYLFFTMALSRNQRSLQRAALALGGVFVAFVALSFGVHHSVALPSTSEYAISPNPLAYLRTLFNQIASAAPLTYFARNPYVIFPDRLAVLFDHGKLTAAAIGLGFALTAAFVVLYRRAQRISDYPIRERAMLLIFGLAFAIIPALLIPLSQRWQREIKFGLPYQPVYLEGYGFAVLIALLVDSLFRRSAMRRGGAGVAATVAVLLGLTVFVTYQCNASILPRYAPAWEYPRTALEQALSRGGLGSAPEGSTVVLDDDYPPTWDDSMGYVATKYLLYMFTERRYSVVVVGKTLISSVPICAAPLRSGTCSNAVANLYYLRVSGTSETGAKTVLLHVRSFAIAPGGKGMLDIRGERGLIYASGTTVDPSVDSGRSYRTSRLVSRADYQLLDAVSNCGTLSIAALNGFDVSAEFADGFYGPEGIGDDQFHWASQGARMLIVNHTDQLQKVAFNLRAQTFVPGLYQLRLQGPNFAAVLPLSTAISTYDRRFIVLPRASLEINLTSNAPQIQSPGDPRNLHFRIFAKAANKSGNACTITNGHP